MQKGNVAGSVLGTILKISITALVIFAVYTVAMKAYNFGYLIFDEKPLQPGSEEVVSVAIVEGKSVMEIGKILEEKELIQSARLFYFQELFSSYKDELKPGIYELSPSMTSQEMMEIMATQTETAENVETEADAGTEEEETSQTETNDAETLSEEE